MVQEILMWISVAGAFGYTAFSLGKSIWSAYQDKPSDCAGTCGGCSAKTDLLKQVQQNKIKPIHLYRPNH
ncbi:MULTISPECIES: FeoB-associated Cys-rich membrane protein [unclassified Saccharicrinis]|uniref:FeoB-associated Cys-rich membrane protein n=1 Tax=unclassified Saccharicrinis TaxID=2646859 RepID=UPI003D32E521